MEEWNLRTMWHKNPFFSGKEVWLLGNQWCRFYSSVLVSVAWTTMCVSYDIIWNISTGDSPTSLGPVFCWQNSWDWMSGPPTDYGSHIMIFTLFFFFFGIGSFSDHLHWANCHAILWKGSHGKEVRLLANR